MSEVHYLSNKFSRIAKRWGISAPATSFLRFWRFEVAWFGQIAFFFKLIMTKSNFKNQLWHHRYYITEKRHQINVTKFFHFGPLPIKISALPVNKTHIAYLLSWHKSIFGYKLRTDQEQLRLKILKKLRTASLNSKFTDSYK